VKLPRLGLVRKFFKKLTVLSTIVGLLFQSFIPTVLLAYPAPVAAIEMAVSPSVSLQYDSGAHTFALDVFGVSKTSYTLTYQHDGGVTEAVEGTIDASSDVAHASLYAGTCSTGGVCVPHDVQSGTIHVDALYGDTQSYMYDENFSFNNGVFWNEHDRVYTTPKVELNKTYVAPQNGAVTVTFTSLPTNPGTLSIQELTLTEEQKLQLGAISDKAYDITSTMADGTFTYTLTLPVPDLGENSDTLSVASSEDGQRFENVAETQQTFHEEKQEIEVRSLDHFTVFVIRDPSASGVDGAGGSWVNPGNVYVSDNARATVLLNLGATSENLLATGFGLSVPGTAVIEGVEVMIEKSVNTSRTNASKDSLVNLIVGGVVVGNNNAGASYFNNTTDAVTTYGSSSDLWGLTLTPAQVNSGDFGVAYAAQRHPSGSSDQRVRVDHMQVKVYYNTPPTITITSPDGGQIYQGGSAQDITWNANDVDAGALLSVALEYTTDGSTYTPIVSGLANVGSYTWTLPGETSQTVRVRATVSDTEATASDDSDADFIIDTTAPTMTYDGQSPISNAYGWNNTSVTLSWTCSDATSGVINGTVTETLSGEGEDQSATGVCTDNAGNSSSDTQNGIDIDLTAPTGLGTPTSDAATNPTNINIITWTWAVPDSSISTLQKYLWNLSKTLFGIVQSGDTTSDSVTTTIVEGDGEYAFDVQAVDKADNTTAVLTSDSVTLDQTGPVLQSFSSPESDDIYGPGSSIALEASYDETLAPGSTITMELDNGVSVTLDSVSGNTLSGTYIVGTTGSGEDSADLTVSSISSESVMDALGNTRTDSDLPASNIEDTSDLEIDTTAPTNPTLDSTSHSISTWSNDSTVDVEWDGAGDSSGINGYSFEWDTNASTNPDTTLEPAGTTTTSPSLTDGDSHYFHLHTEDAVGNWSDNADLGPFYIDLTKPTSTISDPANTGTGSTTYINSWAGALGGSSADTLASVNSDVNHVDLSIRRSSDGLYWDGVAWVAGTETTTRVTTAGAPDWTYTLTSLVEDTYTVTSHAVDNATNVEDSYVLTIVYDLTLPTVSSSISPATPDGANDWYLTEPTITITGADDILLNHLEYQWNGTSGAWTTYSVPFTTFGEGGYTVYFRAFDEAGNVSLVGSRLVKYDKTELDNGPLNVSISPNPTGGSTATVKWDAAKDNVGISKYEVQWTLNGSSTGYTDTVGSNIREHVITNLTEGTWTVRVRAFDDAGHNKDATINEVVDRTAPVAPTLSLTGTGTGTASLAWNTVADATDYIIWYGVTTGTYIYGARVGNVSSYTVQGLGAGSYFFIVRAVDASNNQSANSNEVSTGAIAGAPGVQPGAPAQGFAPEVLGKTTTEEATPSPSPTQLGSIEGAQTNDWEWLWWLTLTLPVGGALYFLLRRRVI